jgi:hypothetical protein
LRSLSCLRHRNLRGVPSLGGGTSFSHGKDRLAATKVCRLCRGAANRWCEAQRPSVRAFVTY